MLEVLGRKSGRVSELNSENMLLVLISKQAIIPVISIVRCTMKLGDLSRSEQAKILADYHDNRDIGREVFEGISNCLSGDAVIKSAKKLGLAAGKEIIAQNENELTILMDYAYHNQRNGLFNAIERFANMNSNVVAEYPEFFKAINTSFYSVFSVMSVTPGLGITVEDMLTGENIHIIDVGFSHSPRVPNMCGRIIPFKEGYYCTSGAMLPLFKDHQQEAVDRILVKFSAHKLSMQQPVFSKKQEAAFQAEVIRYLLKTDASERVDFI